MTRIRQKEQLKHAFVERGTFWTTFWEGLTENEPSDVWERHVARVQRFAGAQTWAFPSGPCGPFSLLLLAFSAECNILLNDLHAQQIMREYVGIGSAESSSHFRTCSIGSFSPRNNFSSTNNMWFASQSTIFELFMAYMGKAPKIETLSRSRCGTTKVAFYILGSISMRIPVDS